MYILTSLFSTLLLIQLLQFCAEGHINDVEFNRMDNKIYPWLVRIKEIEPEEGNGILCYGTLIAPNAVITRLECLIDKIVNDLVVESYYRKTPFGVMKDDYITSNVSELIKQDSAEAYLKQEDPTVILILKKSLIGNYGQPISIANNNTINEKKCFFAIWPSGNPSETSDKIDLHKSTHMVHIWNNQVNDIQVQTHQFSRDIINAISRADYYDLQRLQIYSDHYISRIEGSSLVCALRRNPKKYALVGITPGYLLPICKNGQENCLSVLYFINIIGQGNEIMQKIKKSIPI